MGLLQKNRLKNGACRQIALQDIAIRCKVRRGGLFREVQKSQQNIILQLLDSQIVKPALPGREPVGSKTRSRRLGERAEQGRTATAKQLRMAQLEIGRAHV